MPAAWVYMLRCRDGSLYTGWSTDVARRQARHRAGKASSYTASRLPVELVFTAAMADSTAARREEARIKALDRAGKLELIAAAPKRGARSAGVSDRALSGCGRSGDPASGSLPQGDVVPR
jgi:putative endonuclease